MIYKLIVFDKMDGSIVKILDTSDRELIDLHIEGLEPKDYEITQKEDEAAN